MKQTVEQATQPISDTTIQNLNQLTEQAKQNAKNRPQPAEIPIPIEKPKGCIIFKENCTCFDKLNNKIETTEPECKNFIKSNF